MEQTPRIPLMDRIRLIGYGVIGGLVAGAILGWLLHGVISFVVRFGIVLLLLLPFVLAVIFWRKMTGRSAPAPQSPVSEADWIEIDATSRPRR